MVAPVLQDIAPQIIMPGAALDFIHDSRLETVGSQVGIYNDGLPILFKNILLGIWNKI